MKKQLLFITVALLFSVIIKAQSGLTNLSFENWTSGFFGVRPVGWMGMTLSKQTNSVQQGTYYVRITTTSTVSPTNCDGILMLGYAIGSNFYPGAPVSQKPITINGYYKTSGLGVGDTVGVYGVLESAGSFVSYTEFKETTNISNWTSFSTSFTNYTQTPDTIEIYAYSNAQAFGGGPNKISSVLDLDNLSLDYDSGIDELSIGTAFLVFPNPATNELTIISKDENATSVLISDLNGRVIKEIEITNEKTKIDLETISSGVYTYSIMNKQKTKLLSNKFIKN